MSFVKLLNDQKRNCLLIASHEVLVSDVRKLYGIPDSVKVDVIEEESRCSIGSDILKFITDESRKGMSLTFGVQWKMPVFFNKDSLPLEGVTIEVDTIRGFDYPGFKESAVEAVRDSWKIAIAKAKNMNKNSKKLPDPEQGFTLCFCDETNTIVRYDAKSAVQSKATCLRMVTERAYSSIEIEDIRPHFDFEGFHHDTFNAAEGRKFDDAFAARKEDIMKNAPLFDTHCEWVHRYLLSIAALAPAGGTNEAFRRLLINPMHIAAASCISADVESIKDFCDATGVANPGAPVAGFHDLSVISAFAVEYNRKHAPYPMIGRGPLDYRLYDIVTDCSKEPSKKKQRTGNDEEDEEEDDDEENKKDFDAMERSNLDEMTSDQVERSLAHVGVQITEAKPDLTSSQKHLVKCLSQLGAQMHDELQCLHDAIPSQQHVKGILSTGQHYLFFVAYFGQNKKKILQYLGRSQINILKNVSKCDTSLGRASGGAIGGVTLKDVKELIARLIFFTTMEVTEEAMDAFKLGKGEKGGKGKKGGK